MNALAVEPILDARYVLLEAIGRGGMGLVYRAFDRETERTVALKVLHGATGRGPFGKPRAGSFGKLRTGPASPLADEFAAWARLRHPNIVRAHALGFAARGPLSIGTPYLVLEHVAGAPIHRALAPGREDPVRIEGVARQILQALVYVHETGWVHRDLKPGNVLARSTSRGSLIKLTDFGLATSAGSTREPGRVSGSLPYVAPEAILGGRLDGRSDLYSLGILLFFLICGRLPCETREPDAVVRWHVSGPPADPRAIQTDCPDRLARLVARLTARDPSARPVNARDALDALSGTARSSAARIRPVDGSGSPATGTARRRRSKPQASETPPALMRRSEVATLRLAFDAARVGAWRTLAMEPDRAASDALAAEACVLAQLHGATLLRLARSRGEDGPCLGRLVLRLLLSQGAGARELARRHGLELCFPLGFFGGLPVWDRMREERGATDRNRDTIEPTARGIAAFVAEAIGPGPTVLVVARSVLREPLTRAVVARLCVTAQKRSAPRPAGGGLLVVTPSLDTDAGKSTPLRRA